MEIERSIGAPEHAIEVLKSENVKEMFNSWQVNVIQSISIVCIVLAVLEIIVWGFVWIKTRKI